MTRDLTKGSVASSIIIFAIPMILGNMLQQCYNVADTLIVGKFLGKNALAAVGSSFTLMSFITSILLGLCMGSGIVYSMYYGKRDTESLRQSITASFVLVASIAIIVNILAFLCLDKIRAFLNIPSDVWDDMRAYIFVIFMGIPAVFLYNFFASYTRAIGNSVVPLVFLAISAILNIFLDLLFVLSFKRGVAGAAEATIISQYVSGVGIAIYALAKYPDVRWILHVRNVKISSIREVGAYSILTSVQQSIMNLGILMVQGLINSFGTVAMAASAAATKIDDFAYMPVQDFGNAFSTFIAQNYGARESDRIRQGIRYAVIISISFCVLVGAIVYVWAAPLMRIFINASELEIIAEGVRYLHIKSVFYFGIGCLFLLYGLYRALGQPSMSVVLTITSLGTRVVVAYALSSIVGVVGIWWSVPIGWVLADTVGFVYLWIKRRKLPNI